MYAYFVKVVVILIVTKTRIVQLDIVFAMANRGGILSNRTYFARTLLSILVDARRTVQRFG